MVSAAPAGRSSRADAPDRSVPAADVRAFRGHLGLLVRRAGTGVRVACRSTSKTCCMRTPGRDRLFHDAVAAGGRHHGADRRPAVRSLSGRHSRRHRAGDCSAPEWCCWRRCRRRPGVADIVWRMAVCGIGFGFFQAPNLKALMSSAPPGRSGSASSIVATARLTGQTIGAALAALCFGLAGRDGAVLGSGARRGICRARQPDEFPAPDRDPAHRTDQNSPS